MRVFWTAVLLLCLACVLSAQETRGMISGTVTDPTGAAMVGANVAVTNTETNTSTRLTTNTSGYYEAPLLMAGRYQVVVESAGFKKLTRSNLVLAIGDQLKIDLVLEIGAVTDSVTVSAESPILDTSTVATGKVLSHREVMDLPVMTNDIVTLARYAPGVVNQGTTQYLSQGMVGGSSGFYAPLVSTSSGSSAGGGNEWTIDGAPNNGSGRGIAFTPYTDMISEFRVETANFDASFGHSLGLNVSFASKAGTNELHGTATWQYWNQHWNANPFFIKQSYYRNINAAIAAGNTQRAEQLRNSYMRPGGHSNNGGFTVTGPVYIPKVINGKNKLFFFFAYSLVRDRQPARPSEINFTVPTMAQRAGDFSQLLNVDAVRYAVYDPLSVRSDPARPGHYIRTPMANNFVPQSRITMPKMYNFFLGKLPKPNNDPLSANAEPWNNYQANTMPDNVNYKGFNNRIDYNLSEKHRLFFRWTYSLFYEDAQDWTNEVERGFRSWDNYRNNKAAVVDYTWTKSASTVVNVNVAANQWWSRLLHNKMMSYKPSDLGLPSYMDTQCAAMNGCAVPHLIWGSGNYSDAGWAVDPLQPFRSQGIKANLSHVRGVHTFRGGVDLRQHYRNNAGGAGNSSGYFEFNSDFVRKDEDGATPYGQLGLGWASFMMGMPTTVATDTNASLAMMNPFYAFYGQDTWRVSRNLTVTLGLRAEYELGPTERYNRMVTYYDPNAQLPISSGVQAAYAANPIVEVPASSFIVKGGNVYAGANGADRKQWKNQLMWLPRLSAAWQFNEKMVVRGGYGIYYDTLNVMNEGVNQFGYSRTTVTNLTNDAGVNWLAGNPQGGVSPLADPFPVRADGTRFDAPLGNALGSMMYAGRGFGFTPYEREHPRIQRWRGGIQRQLSPNMVIEVAYWGQWADKLGVGRNLASLPQSYWATGNVRNDAIPAELNRNLPNNPFNRSNFASLATSNPTLWANMSTLGYFTSNTISKNRLIRPYQVMNGLSDTTYDGLGKSHSLEVNFDRRFSKGFNFTGSYTRGFSKLKNQRIWEFDAGPTMWIPANSPLTHRFIATAIYEIPFGPGRKFVNKGILSHIVGNWQSGWTYEFQSGPMLNQNWGDYFYYGDINNINADLTSTPKTFDQWFNTGVQIERSASKGPAGYHLRTFPFDITSVRADGLNQWNANLRRDIVIKERLRIELRADALNLMNRSQMLAPDMSPYSTNFGKITTQSSSLNRFYQFQARIQF